MMKSVLVAIILLTLAGCAGKQPMTLHSDVHVISADELPKYWLLKNKYLGFRIPETHRPPSGTKGYIKIKYIIDSNGNVFNPEIIESQPENLLDYSGLKALKKYRYSPADENPDKTPVQVVSEFHFEFG